MSISPTLGWKLRSIPSQFPCIARGWGSRGVLLTGALIIIDLSSATAFTVENVCTTGAERSGLAYRPQK